MTSARRLSDALSDTPELAGLQERINLSRRAAIAIAELCAELTPGFNPIAPGSCVALAGAIRLTVDSAASAAKLRQLRPRLLQALSERGFEGIEIVLRIQPGRMHYLNAVSSWCEPQPATVTSESSGRSAEEIVGPLMMAEKLALTFKEGPALQAAKSLAEALRLELAKTRES